MRRAHEIRSLMKGVHVSNTLINKHLTIITGRIRGCTLQNPISFIKSGDNVNVEYLVGIL